MNAGEIIEEVQKRKLFVDGGPVIDSKGEKRGMFWIVTLRSIDTPRGCGPTLEEAYRDWERKMLL